VAGEAAAEHIAAFIDAFIVQGRRARYRALVPADLRRRHGHAPASDGRRRPT
jgi:hypothetical protein